MGGLNVRSRNLPSLVTITVGKVPRNELFAQKRDVLEGEKGNGG